MSQQCFAILFHSGKLIEANSMCTWRFFLSVYFSFWLLFTCSFPPFLSVSHPLWGKQLHPCPPSHYALYLPLSCLPSHLSSLSLSQHRKPPLWHSCSTPPWPVQNTWSVKNHKILRTRIISPLTFILPPYASVLTTIHSKSLFKDALFSFPVWTRKRLLVNVMRHKNKLNSMKHSNEGDKPNNCFMNVNHSAKSSFVLF